MTTCDDIQEILKNPEKESMKIEFKESEKLRNGNGQRELGYEIVAIIELTISKGKMLEVERDISHQPNIFGVYDITGTYDALIIAKFKTKEELSQLVKKINGYEYVVRTNTHLVLNIIKEDTSFKNLILLEEKE